jgi:hypothetical protein
MKRGNTYSDVAVYLPSEDAWCAGVMPKEKQFIWAWGHYEMRYVYFPEELDGYNPTWINGEFLEKASVEDGVMKVGNAEYKSLYLNSSYLDYKVIVRLLDFARKGLKIILKKIPEEPGTILHQDYAKITDALRNSENVSSVLPEIPEPFLSGNNPPRHWCRKEDNTLYIFFPNPKADRLKFPLEYGQSLNSETNIINATIAWQGENIDLNLVFQPYQSLLYRIENGKAEKIDIEFVPKTPIVKKRPEGYEAPWRVK